VGQAGFLASLAVVAVLAPRSSTHAQSKRPLTLVDLAELPRLLDPQLSPDGRTLVYLQSLTDWKGSRLAFHLWRQDVGGGAPRQITFSDGGEFPGFTRWSPDGTRLAFVRDNQIFMMAADGGEARQLTHHGTPAGLPSWAPDGSAVYFLAPDVPTTDERDSARARDDVYLYDETYRYRHVWKVVVSTGAEMQITQGAASELGYRLSADGKRLAIHRSTTSLVGDAYRSEIWLMDADGKNPRVLTHNNFEETGAEMSPDGTQVLFLAEATDKLEPYANWNLFIVPSTGGGLPRAAVPDFKYAVDAAAWAPDGKSIYAVVNMGVHEEIFRIDVASRSAKQLTDGRHYIPATAGGWSLAPRAGVAGVIVMQFDEPTRYGDVWTMPLSSASSAPGGAPTRITGVYDAFERGTALPRQEAVQWKSTDGTAIEGVLFYPIDYREGARYPLVVQLHGGPMESDKFGFGGSLLATYVPVLAARGYAVLRPNYRGSSGYGNAFYRDVIGGRYFRNMADDVTTGVEALVKQGIADPDRLAVNGWSAGGHLVNKLITMTDRFKAAASGAGVANWLSMYGQTDTRANRTIWFGGTPWQKNAPIAAYWNNSPIKDVANVRTPTLFFVGENDPRVPMPQSIEMYRALKSLDVPAHLYAAPRESHQWLEIRHLLFKANVELEWFEKYVRGRPYVWEQAP
jgi:dipeptidyl aminopeptidase/acylaminoacyl peptidase